MQVVQFFSTREQDLHTEIQGWQIELLLKIQETYPKGHVQTQEFKWKLRPVIQAVQLEADK